MSIWRKNEGFFCHAVELLRFLIKVCNLIKLKDELKVDSF